MIRFLCLVLMDIISIPIIYTLAYCLKFKLGFIYNSLFNASTGYIYLQAQLEPYIEHVILIIFIWIICLAFFGLYKKKVGFMSGVDYLISLVKVVSFISILVASLYIVGDFIPKSKFVFLYAWFIGIVILFFNRKAVDFLLRKYNKDTSFAIVGGGKDAQELLEKLLNKQTGTKNYVGSFYDQNIDEKKFSIQKIQKNIGTFNSIKQHLKDNPIQEIYLVVPEYPEDLVNDMVMFCEENNISINIYYTLTQMLSGVSSYSDIAGIPVVSYKNIELNIYKKVIKRIMDLFVSIVLILLTFPIMACVAVWIKMVSPKGTVMFKQKRVGHQNSEFMMFKFRTMYPDAEKETGPKWVTKEDNRYIRGGKFIRRYSLDELPQLYNVLINDMSLIGPRPERPYFVNQICKDAPYFNLRHKIKGGLTGWAQVNGRAYLTHKPLEKFRYDLFYIKNWSLVLDVKILIQTFVVVIKGEEAY